MKEDQGWRSYCHSLAVALQFLTQIPINFTRYPNATTVGRSLLFYPLVGLLIGGLLSGLALLLSVSSMSVGVGAAIVLSGWLWMSGALHMDGLADSADAWLGGHGDKVRTLAIMKDPASGPIAVVVIACILLLKWSALTQLIEQQSYVALLVAPLLARTVLVPLLLHTPYVRAGGIGEQLVHNAPMMRCTCSVVIALLLALWLSSWLVVVTACVVLFLLRAAMLKRLQGLTGDTAGASVEVVETAVLLALVV